MQALSLNLTKSGILAIQVYVEGNPTSCCPDCPRTAGRNRLCNNQVALQPLWKQEDKDVREWQIKIKHGQSALVTARNNANITAQLQQLAQLVQAQKQQVPSPAQAAPPVVFAVTLGQYAVNQVIDYTTKAGAALYEAGSKTLTTKFDMKPESTLVFITKLKHRAREVG